MPPPGAGKGNWGSKPGVSEAAAEGAASAAQAYRGVMNSYTFHSIPFAPIHTRGTSATSAAGRH